MAQLYPQGTLKKPAAPYPVPGAVLTLADIRAAIGTGPGETISIQHPRGGFVFCRKASPDLVGKFVWNLRASFLCGHLVVGPALVTEAGEQIEWYPPKPSGEK